MRIPKFWVKAVYTDPASGRSFEAWGWSGESRAAAVESGRKRAEGACRAALKSETRRDADEYDYMDAPPREEIVAPVVVEGREVGVVTRNRYGALVLNAADVCFADIDYPPVRSKGLFDAIRLNFSKAARQEREIAVRRGVVERIKAWAGQHPGNHFRLYETAAGLRLLFTDVRRDPTDAATREWLASLGTDPLYLKLTERQACFRARLQPKPRRCGAKRPPHLFPREGAEQERRHADWLRGFEARASGFDVCRLVGEFGRSAGDPVIAAVIRLHDEATGVSRSKPLA